MEKSINTYEPTENMEVGTGLRPTSIRIDDKARKILSELTEKMGAKNQNEVMHALISTWEMNNAKYIVPQKEADIEAFHECTQRLLQIFLANLEDTKDIRNIVRSEYEDSIRSKDALIRDLQRQLEDTRAKFTDAMEISAKKDKEKTEAENQYRNTETELRRVKAEYEQLKSENEDLKRTLTLSDKAVKEHDKLLSERDVLLQEKKTTDFVHKQEIAELELKYKQKLMEEKEKYNAQYLDLLNRVIPQNASQAT